MLMILVYAIKKGVRTCFHQRGIHHTDEYILCFDLQRRRTHILLLCMSAFSNILQTHLEGVVQITKLPEFATKISPLLLQNGFDKLR